MYFNSEVDALDFIPHLCHIYKCLLNSTEVQQRELETLC